MPLKHPFERFTISSTIYNHLVEEFNSLLEEDKGLPGREVAIAQPDQRISLIRAYGLWRKLLKQTPNSDLGIRLARRLTPQRANLIGHLFMESRNLRGSVDLMARYLNLAADNVTFQFIEEGDDAIFSFKVGPKALVHYSVTEFYMFTCYFWALRYCGSDSFGIKEASFNFKVPPHINVYHQLEPGATFHFGQDENFIRMKRSYFYRDNDNHSPYLLQLLTHHAKSLIEGYDSEKSYSSRIVQQIHEMLPHSKPTIEMFADEFQISPRSLRRRLQEEKSNFRDLLDTARREIAHSMISERQLKIEDIAYLLSYDDYSSFSRAFKKWFGSSPTKYRETSAGNSGA